MVKLKQVQAKAEKFYFQKWRGKEKPSPAFDGEIVQVTRSGWNHINKDKRRSKSEILSRLDLLRTAKRILETKRTFDKYKKVGKFEFWSLRSVVKGKVVRVVIRSSIESKIKHFYSVFIEVDRQKK